MPWVYILRCRDESLYVGSTMNLTRRVARHQPGDAGNFTAQRLPVTLAYFEELPTLEEAVARERQLKRWSAQKKHALIVGPLERLRRLAKRRR